ncbi:MAG: hypothetical protein M1827_004773 [Pycnora praestabilis]|nr:MAG: hypothetical protein M1827_004773 [Pycnora praestabilis]
MTFEEWDQRSHFGRAGQLQYCDKQSASVYYKKSCQEHSRKDPLKPVNLDFDARVPIPFSVFPSSYRSDAEQSTTQTRVEGEVNLPSRNSRVGREGHEAQYSSFSTSLPHGRDRTRYEKEEVNVYEDDRDRRPRRKENVTIYEEEHRSRHDHNPEVEFSRERYQEPYERKTEVKVDTEFPRRHFEGKSEVKVDAEFPRRRFEGDYENTQQGTQWAESEIDITERDYRRRTQPIYNEEQRYAGPRDDIKVETETTVDPVHRHRLDMGYYDDEGEYHSFRHGLRNAAERIIHPIHGGPHHHRTEREEIVVGEEERAPRMRESTRESVRFVERGGPPNTVSIPTHHIRIGDLLILQGRPCQVIRITTSAQTGQHRYLGVDLFTKQLHEESSYVSNPSPSVVVQTMLGPVFKQYRVLDMRDDGRVVAMTESGDVKQGLPVIDQGNLWSRLNESFANGRGSVRVLVINDGGRELAVDYKVIHGSRL